jgi:hypothetical protein
MVMRVSVVLLLVGLPALAADGVDDKQKAELKKLEGTWVHVSTEREGEKRPEPRTVWVFEENRAKFYYQSRPPKVDPKTWRFELNAMNHQALCVYILRFFEAELKGDATAKEFLAKQYRHTKLGDVEPHVESVPEGRNGPDPYTEDSALPPTPRQLRSFLREHGSAKTIAVMKRFRKEAPAAPIYNHTAQLYLVTDLLDQGKTQDAIAFSDYFRETKLDCVKVLLQIAQGYQQLGITNWPAVYYKRALLLDPTNSEAAAKLKEIGDGKKSAGGQP